MRVATCLAVLLTAGCASNPSDPATLPEPVAAAQAPTPGALSLDATDTVIGYPARLTASGARRGQQVFLAASLSGVDPVGFCPPQIPDCLNLRAPVFLLGTAAADGAGVATIDTPPLPTSLRNRSLFFQAATSTGTSEVVHRFAQSTSDCGAGIGPIQCVDSVHVASGWDCVIGDSCQDVRELVLDAGQTVHVDVTGVTGSSVVLLAMYAPGSPLSGINLLTGAMADQECTGQNVSTGFDFVAPTAGTYQLAVGRDWGSSAGVSGTYVLDVTSDMPFGDFGQTVDDVDSAQTLTQCGGDQSVSGSWSCGAGQSCQDVYELDLVAGDHLVLSVSNVTGASVPMFSLFRPGASTSGRNELTNTSTDRECVSQNASETLPPFEVTTTGTWTVAMVRDWGSSAGASGSYTMRARTESPLAPPVQVANDVTSGHATSQCAYTSTFSTSWTCASGTTCEDQFEIDVDAGAEMGVAVSGITGSSVVRLSARNPGASRSSINRLNGLSTDKECGTQNMSVSAGPWVATVDGEQQWSIGRDWGSSAGATGSYTATFSVLDAFPRSIRQVASDVDVSAIASACP